jgi:hypothetical protein
MGERGREVAVRRFDARANGSRIISLMKQLAVEGPRNPQARRRATSLLRL